MGLIGNILKDRRSGTDRRNKLKRALKYKRFIKLDERGLSDNEIAQELNISLDIVKRLKNEVNEVDNKF